MLKSRCRTRSALRSGAPGSTIWTLGFTSRRSWIALPWLVVLALASPAGAGLVELDRVLNPCCPSDVAHLGKRVVVAYADPAVVLGVRIHDYTLPSTPTFLAEVDLGAGALGVAASGTEAYVVTDDGRLSVLDLSIPATPALLASMVLAGAPHDIEVVGTRAYVATSDAGMRIIDVSVPSAPAEIGSYAPPSSSDVLDLAVAAGSVVGLCTPNPASNGGHELVIVSTAAAASPSLLFSATFGDSNVGHVAGCNRIASDGTRFYFDGGRFNVVPPTNSLEAYDALGAIASIPIPNGPADIDVVAALGNAAYVSSFGRLQTYDFSVPAAPVLASDKDAGAIGVDAELSLAGSIAYATAGSESVIAIDTSSLVNPIEISRLTPNADSSYDVALAGSHALVTDAFEGLRVIDVADPSDIAQVAKLPGYGHDIEVQGAVAYTLIPWPGVLQLIDVTNPVGPVELGAVAIPGVAQDVEISGGYAYVAARSEGLRVIDVSVPATPVEVGFIVLAGQAHDVVLDGTQAYVAARSGGLRIVDVSVPSTPVEIASIPAPPTVRHVQVSAGHVFIFVTPGLMNVYDVSNPAAPAYVTSLSVNFSNSELAEVRRTGTRLFVPGGEMIGLTEVDIADPANPFVVESTLAGEAVYATADLAGEVISAELSRGVATYEVPEPSLAALFGAGASMLVALASRHRRRAPGSAGR